MGDNRLGVVVCDDDAHAAHGLADYARRLCVELQVSAHVVEFTDPSLLLDSWPDGACLLFLDMEMPLVDGMAVAREIRSRGEDLPIVFVTSYDRYAVQGYEVARESYYRRPYGRRLHRDSGLAFQSGR